MSCCLLRAAQSLGLRLRYAANPLGDVLVTFVATYAFCSVNSMDSYPPFTFGTEKLMLGQRAAGERCRS
jgi:hypothetical protein